MKRSYPYTGAPNHTQLPPSAPHTGHSTVAPPQSAPSSSATQSAPGASSGADYSNYGYGPQQGSSSKMTPDEQQAQWHQQWQQYYAQQAAAAAATPAVHQQQQPMPHQQAAGPQGQQQHQPSYGGYSHTGGPPQQQQQPNNYYSQPQQPQTPHPQPGQYAHGPYAGPVGFAPGGMPGPQQQNGPVTPYGPQQPQQTPYYPPQNGGQQPGLMLGGGGSPAPPAKRQRFDGGGQGPSGYNAAMPMQGTGSGQQYQPIMNAQWGGGGGQPPMNGPVASTSYAWPGASSPVGGPQMMNMPGHGSNGPPAPSVRGGGSMRNASNPRGGFGGVNAISSTMAAPTGQGPTHQGSGGGNRGGSSMRGGRSGLTMSNGASAKIPSRPAHGPQSKGPPSFGQQQQHPLPSRGVSGSYNSSAGGKVGGGSSATGGMRGGGMTSSRGGLRSAGTGPYSNSHHQKWNSSSGPSKAPKQSQMQQLPTGPGANRSGTPSNKGPLSRAPITPSSPALSHKAVSLAARSAVASDQPVPSTSKRTFTDFRMKAIEIPQLDWSWSLRAEMEKQEEEDQNYMNGLNSEGNENRDQEGNASQIDDESVDLENGQTSATQTKAVNGNSKGAGQGEIPASAQQPPPRGPASDLKPSARKESCRLRICFSAVTVMPPDGPPSGPKGNPTPPTGPSSEKKRNRKAKLEVKQEAETNGEQCPSASAALDSSAEGDESSTVGSTKKKKIANAETSIKAEPEEENEVLSASLESAAIEMTPNGLSAVESWSGFSKVPPQGAPNRVSMTYFGTRRRLVIETDVVKSLRVFRAEGRIEITLKVVPSVGSQKINEGEGREWMLCKGILMETRDRDSDHFVALARPELEYAWNNETDLKPKPELSKEEKRAQEKKGRNGKELPQQPSKKRQKKKHTTTVGDDLKAVDDPEDDEDGSESVTATVTAGEDDMEDTVEEDVAVPEEERLVPSGPYYTLPPLFRLAPRESEQAESSASTAKGFDTTSVSDELVINVYLDKLAPLSEAKWLKTGDVEDWLSALPGFAHSLFTEDTWHQKIQVVDPDPPPTIFDVFADWSSKSVLGTGRDRRRFILERLNDSKGQIEILCRLVRGERASTVTAKEMAVGPGSKGRKNVLAEASKMTSYPSHQTHLSLAVLALFGMANEYAVEAGEDKEIFEGRIRDILMGLPQNLVFKALDALWKEVMERNARASAAEAKNASSSKIPRGPAASKSTSTGGEQQQQQQSTSDTGVASASTSTTQKRKASGPMDVAEDDPSSSTSTAAVKDRDRDSNSKVVSSSSAPTTEVDLAAESGSSSGHGIGGKKSKSVDRGEGTSSTAVGDVSTSIVDVKEEEEEEENGGMSEEEEEEEEEEDRIPEQDEDNDETGLEPDQGEVEHLRSLEDGDEEDEEDEEVTDEVKVMEEEEEDELEGSGSGSGLGSLLLVDSQVGHETNRHEDEDEVADGGGEEEENDSSAHVDFHGSNGDEQGEACDDRYEEEEEDLAGVDEDEEEERDE